MTVLEVLVALTVLPIAVGCLILSPVAVALGIAGVVGAGYRKLFRGDRSAFWGIVLRIAFSSKEG